MGKNSKANKINETGAKELIKNGKVGGFYFIYGDENYLKLYYAEQFAKKAVGKDFEDFNMHRLDGKNTSVETIKDAVESLPMLSEHSCVFVYDLPIYDLKQEDAENLLTVLSDVPDSCCLILLMENIVKKGRGNKNTPEKPKEKSGEHDNSDSDDTVEGKEESVKTNIWEDILTIAQNNGFAIELKRRNINELTNMLTKGASFRGKKIEERTARYFVENVGNDIANLQNELDKICAFVNHEKITEKDIDLIAVKTVEARVFDMAESLIDKNSDIAYGILDTLISQRVEPVLIMGTLIFPFVDMYRVKVALIAGHRPDDVAKYFNYKSTFRLTKQAKPVGKFTMNQLDVCLDILNDADSSIKSRSIDQKLIIEQTMTRIVNTLSKKK
jgi:DNA polymerase-3 subunit delta